jgi:hypothetical protein
MSVIPAARSLRPAAVLAVLTLLAAVAALLALSGTAHAADRNCTDFRYQEDAQAVLEADPTDPNNLDSSHDGKACETLPSRGSSTTTTAPTTTTPTTATEPANSDAVVVVQTTVTTTTTPSTTSSTTTSTTASTSTTTDDSDSDESDDSESDDDNSSSGSSSDDRDCADFASQADAQAALTAKPSDPDNLDADDDGIACEDHFGEVGQQVQVHPTGGVDTGGEPAHV